MAFPPYAARVSNFLRDANAGLESPSPLKTDAELNALINVVNQLVLKQRGFTNSDGTLRNFATATAQALAGTEDFVATASQTAFVTTIPWTAAFTAENVFVYIAGLKLDTADVAVADDGNGFLEVTIAAQTVGTGVTVAAFESGAGLLSRLQTVSVSDGASLIAINDAGGLYAAVTVEAALQEVMTDLNTLETNVGTTADLIRRTGTVAFTANQSMGGYRITNVADGVGAQDAVTMAQFAAYTTVWNALATYFLRLDGTTPMGANLPMGNNKITGMANGTDSGDAVNKGQLDLYLPLAGGTMSGPIAMGAQKITGLAAGVAATDAVNLSQAQSLLANFATLVSTVVAGTSSFVVPAGVTKIKCEVFGAGGGGKGGGAISTRRGGGGGGFCMATLDVTPGESLTVVVGSGGTGGTVPTSGGASSISRGITVLVSAGGGSDGNSAAGNGAGGANSFDGSVTGFSIPGGRGSALSNQDSVDVGGGFGGNCPRGGQGGPGDVSPGGYVYKNGDAPGGGGGPGDSVGAGSGAAGAVLIWY